MAKDTRFKPGQSGNPGGRPKMPEDLQAKIRDLCPVAVGRLQEHMASSDARISLDACKAILERAYGKPVTPVETKFETDAPGAHLAALTALAQKRASHTQPADDIPTVGNA
jgi:hypothetical protein